MSKTKKTIKIPTKRGKRNSKKKVVEEAGIELIEAEDVKSPASRREVKSVKAVLEEGEIYEKLETPKDMQEKKVEEVLETLGEAVSQEVSTKIEKDIRKINKNPITFTLESPKVRSQIGNLKEVAGSGLHSTRKNVIIFYERASIIGDRTRGFLYLLLGMSIFFTGFFATQENLLTFKDIISTLMTEWIGRLLVVVIGLSLVAFGMDRMFPGHLEKLKKHTVPKVRKKYTQKKLNEVG
ncbi:MAG: DUF1206 domain-containing protein [archaeon]|jgi:hypothetical protein|nr:DUF1206 domain-containing protein [archaeon]